MDWNNILIQFVNGLQFFLLFFWIYWFFISLFGFGKPKRQKEHAPQKRMLIMVPAHNEAEVIGQLVDNLMSLDYPKDLYEVCVIADNCNDSTAEIARKGGAFVLEHFYGPGEPKGKPYAIKFAVDYYGDRLVNDFDSISFFDADNLVSSNFLKEMNNHLLNGDKLIQCFLDSKNPQDNWITLSYASSYYFMNRSWQLAKSRLHLGNAIGGTGFCVDTKLFSEVGWTAKSLTEDLEFTTQCLLRGVQARWSHFARVYDEKPTEFKASVVQRLRWARGHWDVCMKYIGKLLWRAVTKGDINCLDGAIYLLNPFNILFSSLVTVIVWISTFYSNSMFIHIMPAPVWYCLVVFQFFYIGYCNNKDSNKKINTLKSFLSLFLLNITYIPLYFWSLLTFKNKDWNPTKHTKGIHISEMENKAIDKR